LKPAPACSKNASTDGHSEKGTLSFTVGAAAAAAPGLPAPGATTDVPTAGLLALAAAALFSQPTAFVGIPSAILLVLLLSLLGACDRRLPGPGG
jgi:hypothetical protein